MADLPDEVLERIFRNVVQIDLAPSMWLPIATYEGIKQREIARRIRLIAKMRLVCRRWADWLYASYLYDELSFKCAYRASTFIHQLAERPRALPLPQCRYLKVHEIWTSGAAPPGMAEIESLDALVEQFSETIVALDIRFVNFFTLWPSTIEKIGGIRNLRFLRLGIRFTRVGGGKTKGVSVDRDMTVNGLPTDSECLASLLRAVDQKLVALDFTDFRPVCSPTLLGEVLGDYQCSTITTLKLDVKTEGNLTLDGIVRLSAKLPNLKVLWIGGPGHQGEILLPIFESLREKLEELYVTDARVLQPVLNISFPRLRVVRVHDWDRDFPGFLRKNMFASVEILALNCFPFHKKHKKILPWMPLATLPHLRRVEFHEASGFLPTRWIEDQCDEHEVERVYPRGDTVGEDGRAILDFDAPSALLNQLKI
ncbi:hypothetical protein PtA15_4A857 [Puccinia triticina]|uniref:F-box domain-containing protein n=2 Tax=Puccinia triticina TaxID=208348 RepID=A0ABY7CGM7_9BASI|nr:uncharacterized protein PtA15_4A857 [Puccinia triticina]WAQ84404.1 hypothetical protein PtA15_4A857 [Puccinia triticina]